MADIYSTVSIVAFILAGIALLAAVILFFTLNIRGTYKELRGQTDKNWVAKQQKKQQNSSVKNLETKTDEKTVKSVLRSSLEVDDEAVTVLESGEEVTQAALIGVYEPGTDAVGDDEVATSMADDSGNDESATVTEESFDETFKVRRKEVFIHSSEIIK